MEIQSMGVTVHYELYGKGERRVVLLHGWGCDVKLMRPIAQALQEDMSVLALDFPAHGQSGRPPEPWGVPDFAACLMDVLKRLDFLPCSVIAHSFGGRVTIELASRDDAPFDKLILTGSAGIKPPPTEAGKKRSAAFARWKRWCGMLKKLRIFGRLPQRLEDAARKKYGSRDYNALDADMRKTFVKVVAYDQTDQLKSICRPTLLIWGDQDTETPLWMGKRMEKDIPDAGLVILEGGSHFAYLEQAARFAKIAHVFLMEE